MRALEKTVASLSLALLGKKKRGAVAVRVLTGTKRRQHIPPVLTSLLLPPVHTRIDLKLLSLVHKAPNGLAPQYICLKAMSRPGPLRSSGTGHLDVQRVNSKRGGLVSFILLLE